MLCHIYGKNLTKVKAIAIFNQSESFEGSDTLVTQAKVSWQTTSLAIQLFKIKYQYKYLVKLMETIKRAKYTVCQRRGARNPKT